MDKTCQRADVECLHVVPLTDLGYLALAFLSCGKLPAFFYGEEKCPGHTGICQDWQDERLGIAATLLQIG